MGFFLNEREGRLRAFWRLLFQVFLYFFVQAILAVMAVTVLTLVSGGLPVLGGGIGLGSSPAALVLGGLISLLSALVSVWISGRFFDRRPFSGFGLRLDRDWWLDLGFGLLLGMVLMTGIFLVELAAGWIQITRTLSTPEASPPFLLAILAPLFLFLCVGFGEELVSRGYQLKNMAEGLNYPGLGGPRGAILLAWVLSSSVFGVAHVLNPGATLVSTINIAFAGLLLGVGYVLTGRLAISIGLHITWNFFQGNVFGFPVSGMDGIGASFIEISQGGPTLFTGGAFGPEAGLMDIAATVVGSLLIVLWVRLRAGSATLEPSIAEPPRHKREASR